MRGCCNISVSTAVARDASLGVELTLVRPIFPHGVDTTMKNGALLLPAVFIMALLASGQDLQDCKPDGSYSFQQVKDSVHRVTTTHISFGFDEKVISRSGDLVSVAILQTLDDGEIMSSRTLGEVLLIIRNAFACPSRCVRAASDRQPRVTLLLLEHLHNNTTGSAQSEIDETKKFVSQQAESS